MTKVLVLYYSSYGHIEKLAEAVAEGARGAGAQVDVKRVPETVPGAIAKSVALQAGPGRACRHGRRAGALRRDHRRHRHPLRPHVVADGGLPGPGRRPVDARRAQRQGRRRLHVEATQHGGQETTLFSIITNLLHFGMTIVGLPYSHQGQMNVDEIVGGAPYGATTVAGGDGRTAAHRDRPGRRAAPGRAGREDGGQAVRQCRLIDLFERLP